MRKLIIVLLSLILLIMSPVLSPTMQTTEPSPGDLSPVTISLGATTKSILFASDIHIWTSAYIKTYDRFVRDINENMSLDALFLLGDITHWGTSDQINKFVNQTNNITDYDLRANNTFALLGNHDTASTSYPTVWENWRIKMGYMPNWTYQIGNVLFIAIATTGIQVYGQISDNELNWLNATIKANAGSNIVILSHQPISNTTYQSNNQDRSFLISDDLKLRGLAYYHRSNISAWIHGHNHADDGFPGVTTTWNGIFFADISKIESQTLNSVSWLMNLTEGSKTATMNPRHTGVGVPSYFNTTNARSFNFKYPVDLNGISLKSTSADWTDGANVTLTNFRVVNETLWTDLNPVNDSNTWLLYKFNEFGLNAGNRSIKDWSGRGCNLNYSAYYWNWTNGSGVSPANDGGGLKLTGVGTTGTVLKTGMMTRLCNVTKNFTLEITFRFTDAIAGGTRYLIDKTGEFIWGWDTTGYRMTLSMYWSDSTSNTYYLNFAPNHTFNQRLGSIIHFIATVNTFDHYWKAWYNGISLGTGTIASKTMGYPGAGMFKPFAIVSTQTAGYMLNGTLLGCKISTVEYTSGAMTSTIIIKNPTQALDQTVLGSVLYGHCGGMLERSSKVAVSYSADNITFSSDRSSVPNGKTLYMKAVFTSDGAAGARITGIGLRTAPAGVLLGTNVSERNGRYWINGTYPSLSPTLIPEITVSSAKETSIEALSATGFYLSSADNTTSVDVTVSGLDHLVKYAVTIDGSAWLDYRAVSVAGYYNFTYSGPWSTHYFSLEQYIAPIPVPPEPGPDDTSSGWWLVGVGGIIAVSVIVIMLLANNGSKQTGKKGTGRKHKE